MPSASTSKGSHETWWKNIIPADIESGTYAAMLHIESGNYAHCLGDA